MFTKLIIGLVIFVFSIVLAKMLSYIKRKKKKVESYDIKSIQHEPIPNLQLKQQHLLKKCVVCHDKKSVETAVKRFPDAEILFVGSQEAPENVTVMRNLPKNIEHLPQFLTFCAWWAISHNKMFLDYDFIAILEWDAHTNVDFWEKAKNILGPQVDALGLISGDKKFFWEDTTQKFWTVMKNLNYLPPDSNFFYTSNAILSRKKLDDFVSIYETQIEVIKDDSKCKWAHERIYGCWLNTQKVLPIEGMHHLGANSHSHNKN